VKKLYALLLVTMMLCGIGVASQAGTAPEMSDIPGMTAPGVLPIVTEPTKITIGIPLNPQVLDYDDNALTKRVEEATGIDIEFFFLPTDGQEAIQKIALMVSANQELPDIITNVGIPIAERASYGAQGVFLDINKYLDKYTYFWKQGVENWCTDVEKGNITKMITSPDGGLYAFPFYYSDPTDPQCYAFWINKDWLEKLDLEMPTTTDELFDVLIAFRDKDPNGNGINDEIPLVGGTGWIMDPVMVIMNAFEYYTGGFYSHMLNVGEDGKLYASYTTDAFREGLRYLNKLYSEKLISDLTFTQDYSGGLAALCESETQVVGVFCGHPELCFGKDSLNRMSFTYVSPVTGPDGVCYVPWDVAMPYGNTYITKDCKNPEVAVRLLDYFAMTDTSLCVRYGEQDVDWWVVEDSTGMTPRLPGSSYPIYYESPNLIVGTEQRQMYGTWSLALIPPNLFAALPAATYPDNPYMQYREDNFWASVQTRVGKNPPEVVSRLIFTEEENFEISEIQTSLQTYVKECIAAFMTGTMNVDTDWQTYLDNIAAIGVDRFIQVAQGCYDRMNK
jgi:putative aldouronate transport system substrate-binding protein